MSYRSRVVIAACSVFTLIPSGLIPPTRVHARSVERGQNGKRAVTVADVIQMNRLADELNSLTPIAHFSPDGTRCVVVLRKGNLIKNVNEYSLLLWNTKDMFREREPKTVLTMSSSSNRDAIESVTWLSDNSTIRFLGEQPGQLHQVYSFNIVSNKLSELTDQPTNIIAFSTSANGNKIAYVAEEPDENIWTDDTLREGLPITTQVIYDLVAGRHRPIYTPTYQLFVTSIAPHRHTSRLAGCCGRISPVRYQPYLSPDGNYLAILTIVRGADIPLAWAEYSDSLLHQWVQQRLGTGEDSSLHCYTLIDTNTGKSRILLNSPIGVYSSEAAWSPNSSSIIISDTWLPLSDIRSEYHQQPLSKPLNVEVNISTGEVTTISDDQLVLQGWSAKTGLVAFARGRAAYVPDTVDRIFFAKVHDAWIRIERPSEEKGRPEVIVEQGINIPPTIVALDRASGRRVVLLDVNPQFRNLEFGREEEIEYSEAGNKLSKAGLYYPVDYVPGRRYPLVIQTHGYNPNEFWIDGPYTTAFAAQPLAGMGIMVLQVPESVENMNTPREAEQEAFRLITAVDYLDKKGLIDRDRVGLIGFSRTCMFVDFALTHSNHHFAAASVTDGVDGGYFQYILQANAFPASNLTYEGINGGEPFGDGLMSWRMRAPGFNADKVRTPVLITAPNLDSALFQWEWFAALRRLGKPVDMIVLRDGSHVLQKPSDRLISQQSNVDWFVFWLKGDDHPDPSKAGQYARWHLLRQKIKNDK